jgi:hypothetical protein
VKLDDNKEGLCLDVSHEPATNLPFHTKYQQSGKIKLISSCNWFELKIISYYLIDTENVKTQHKEPSCHISQAWTEKEFGTTLPAGESPWF